MPGRTNRPLLSVELRDGSLAVCCPETGWRDYERWASVRVERMCLRQRKPEWEASFLKQSKRFRLLNARIGQMNVARALLLARGFWQGAS